jgi:hypothetical protein
MSFEVFRSRLKSFKEITKVGPITFGGFLTLGRNKSHFWHLAKAVYAENGRVYRILPKSISRITCFEVGKIIQRVLQLGKNIFLRSNGEIVRLFVFL